MKKIFKALSVAFLSGLAIDMPESKATGLLTQEALAEGDAPEQELVAALSIGDFANGLDLPYDEASRERWRKQHFSETFPKLFGKEMAKKMVEEYRRDPSHYQGYPEKILSKEAIERLHGPDDEDIIEVMEYFKDDPRILLTFARLLAEDFDEHTTLPYCMKKLGLELFNTLLKRLEQPDIHILCRGHVGCFFEYFIDVPDNSQEEALKAFLTTCKIISEHLPDEYLNNLGCFDLKRLLTMEELEKRLCLTYNSFERLFSEKLSKAKIKRKFNVIMDLACFPNPDEIEEAAELANSFLLLLAEDKLDSYDTYGILVSLFRKKSLQKMKNILRSSKESGIFDAFDNYYDMSIASALQDCDGGEDFSNILQSIINED